MERELLHCAFISIYVTDLPVLQESSNAQRQYRDLKNINVRLCDVWQLPSR